MLALLILIFCSSQLPDSGYFHCIKRKTSTNQNRQEIGRNLRNRPIIRQNLKNSHENGLTGSIFCKSTISHLPNKFFTQKLILRFIFSIFSSRFKNSKSFARTWNCSKFGKYPSPKLSIDTKTCSTFSSTSIWFCWNIKRKDNIK